MSKKDKLKCPECGATDRLWRKGRVPSRHGQKVRYVCFDCGTSFYSEKDYAKYVKPKPVKKPKATPKRSHKSEPKEA